MTQRFCSKKSESSTRVIAIATSRGTRFKKKSIISDIENILPNASKRNYINNYGNAYGKSEAHVNDFLMASGDIIRVWCQDWDHNNETVKSYKWWDGLAVNVSSKEQIDFVNKEAY